MNFRHIVFAMLLTLGYSAAAEMVTIVRAYEIAVSELSLPVNEAGTVSFKDCESCDRLTIPVTAATRYVLNDRDVPLDEFKAAVRSVVRRDTTITTVMHHLESDTITAVMVVK